MRDYAKIAPQFWIGATGKAIRKHGAEAQVVALYLLSSPHANMIGLYHLPLAYISADTGIPLEGASKALRCLNEALFCGYDEAAEVVWVYEMAKYQISAFLKPEDKQCAGVQNAYDAVPQNRFLAGFHDKYETAFHMKRRREQASPLEAPSKPLRSQEQEQEQEQEKTTCARARKQEHKIEFDGNAFTNLNGHIADWYAAFPAVDVETEVKKAAVWLKANPRNKKSNYARFITNWLTKAQDKAPALGGGKAIPSISAPHIPGLL